jgi:hypothetical protein
MQVSIYIHHTESPRNPLFESRARFRASPCWLSAFYIITIISAVALEVLR